MGIKKFSDVKVLLLIRKDPKKAILTHCLKCGTKYRQPFESVEILHFL